MHVRGTRVCSEPDALMSTIGWALALNLCLSVVRRTFVATNVAPAVNFVFRANFSAAQESRLRMLTNFVSSFCHAFVDS